MIPTFTDLPTLQQWYQLGAVLTHRCYLKLPREKSVPLVNLKVKLEPQLMH